MCACWGFADRQIDRRTLVKKDANELKEEVTALGMQSRYVYYICGAVSSGKSTVLSHLRSIATVEEWPNKMPVAMNKLSIEATSGEKKEIDNNLDSAIWKKNEEVMHPRSRPGAQHVAIVVQSRHVSKML
jgi:hypothetical protein